MITFSQFLVEDENGPRWERATDRNLYIVYDSDGNVYSEHKYDKVWNSSPAYNAAEKDVQKLRTEERDKQSHYNEYERPLSDMEKDYLQGRAKMDAIHKQLQGMQEGTPEYQQLHDQYMNTANWLKGFADYVRGSVQFGKHKDLKNDPNV